MVQVDLMENAKSEMVKHKAAESVLNILAPPENTQVELQMKQRESSDTSELKQAMAGMARAQTQFLENGGSIKDVAESKIIDGKAEEVE